MTDHCIIKADFSATRTVAGRKVQQLIFELAIEEADEALKKLGGIPHPGKSQPCAIALLDTKAIIAQEQKSSRSDAEDLGSTPSGGSTTQVSDSERLSHKPFSQYTRSQQAAILCNDPDFWEYFGTNNPADAATKVRRHFRIESRSELDNPSNHKRWDEFVAIWNMKRPLRGAKSP